MKKILFLCALLLVPCAAQATSFVYGGSGPIGTFPDAGPLVFPKVTNAAQPGIPANKQLYSDDINAIWQDLLDLRTGVVFGDYFGLTNQPSAPASPASGMRIFDLNGVLSTETAAGVVTSVGDALFLDGGNGLVFTAGAIVQVPSLDAGIVLSRTYGASALTGTNAYSVINNGARIDFGAGANDYATSNGTSILFWAPLALQSSLVVGTSLGTSLIDIDQIEPNTAASVSLTTHKLTNLVAGTAATDAVNVSQIGKRANLGGYMPAAFAVNVDFAGAVAPTASTAQSFTVVNTGGGAIGAGASNITVTLYDVTTSTSLCTVTVGACSASVSQTGAIASNTACAGNISTSDVITLRWTGTTTCTTNPSLNANVAY